MKKSRPYSLRFIQPGLCSYQAEGVGIIYAPKSALDKLALTFKGQPIFDEDHVKGLSQEDLIRAYKDGKQRPAGTIAEVYWNAETGWYDMDIIVWDEQTAANIESGSYFPSCAYLPEYLGRSGTHNGVEFDDELAGGEGTHLAVVRNPRYEGALFFTNKKEEGMQNKLKEKFSKFFSELFNSAEEIKKELEDGDEKSENKNEEQKEAKPENKNEVTTETVIEVDGKEVSLGELLKAFKAAQKPVENQEEEKPVENAVSLDDVLNVEGQEIKIADLVAAYKKSKEAVNEDPEEAQEEKKELNNSVDLKLKKALNNSRDFTPEVETIDDRVKIGKSRYSLKKEDK